MSANQDTLALNETYQNLVKRMIEVKEEAIRNGTYQTEEKQTELKRMMADVKEAREKAADIHSGDELDSAMEDEQRQAAELAKYYEQKREEIARGQRPDGGIGASITETGFSDVNTRQLGDYLAYRSHKGASESQGYIIRDRMSNLATSMFGGPGLTGWEMRQQQGVRAQQPFHDMQVRTPLTSVQSQHSQAVTGVSDAQAKAGGGNLVADQFQPSIEIALKRHNSVLDAGASVLVTAGGNPLIWPTANDTAAKGELVPETELVSRDPVEFATITLNAYKYSSKEIIVPIELFQDDTTRQLAAYITYAEGERIGRITGEHFTTGTGTNQPHGIVTAIPTAAQTSVATAATLTYPDLVKLISSLEPSYQGGAVFMFNTDTEMRCMLIQDGDSSYMWNAGDLHTAAGPTLLGRRYFLNDFMVSMGADGRKFMLYGDMSKYLVRTAMDVQYFRADELYLMRAAVAFIAFARFDAELIDAGTHPIVLMKDKS